MVCMSRYSGNLICTQAGSPTPQNIGELCQFSGGRTQPSPPRVSRKGFPIPLGQNPPLQNLNADTGTRIVVQYSGFPAGASLFVPTVVAGSDATQPTAGGDLGMSASGGKYTPSANSSLLLSFVPIADANGAGGTPAYLPGLPGSGTVSFDSMSQVTLTNGSGVAVYEVVDANSSIQESAQFPTFLTIAPSGSGASITTAENASLGPISTVQTATATDPIPRFQQITPPADCTIVGDCGAHYFPALAVPETSLHLYGAGGRSHSNRLRASPEFLRWIIAVDRVD